MARKFCLVILRIINRHNHCCQKFRAPNCGKLDFLPPASDIKVAQFHQVIIHPFSWILVLFSLKIMKITQLGRKKKLDCWLLRVNNQYWLLFRTSLSTKINWWKECSWILKKLKNTLNWQETGKFDEKRAASDRLMKSSPILGHCQKVFFTRGRRFPN